MALSRQTLFLILSLIAVHADADAKTQWQTVYPGIEYTQILTSPLHPLGRLHALRFSLKQFTLNSLIKPEHAPRGLKTSEAVKQHHILIAINGGFFSPQTKPLGLRMHNGQITNPKKEISWWGIFAIQNKRAKLFSSKRFKPTRQTTFAIQAGPRLVVGGRVMKLKPGLAQRSAIGITRTGDVILAATDKSPITTGELANIMARSEKEDGLNCRDALNLDGGTSTQLSVQLPNFHLDLQSLDRVSDLITVK